MDLQLNRNQKQNLLILKLVKTCIQIQKIRPLVNLLDQEANADVVEYSKTEHSVEIYEDFSGFAEIFKLKVVSPIPVTINVSL